MPLGTGASGKPLAIETEPDLGLELINRLSNEQQRTLDWMHQKFSQATIPGQAPSGAEDRIAKIQEVWDLLIFADLDQINPLRLRYSARIVTNSGELNIELLGDERPSHVKNFVALAKSGFFEGNEFRSHGAFVLAGTPDDEQYYLIRDEGTAIDPTIEKGTAIEKGTVVAFTIPDGKSRGTQFGISLENSEGLGESVIPFGWLVAKSDMDTILQIGEALAKEPGSVRIEKIEIELISNYLFGTEGPDLPLAPAGFRQEPIDNSKDPKDES